MSIYGEDVRTLEGSRKRPSLWGHSRRSCRAREADLVTLSGELGAGRLLLPKRLRILLGSRRWFNTLCTRENLLPNWAVIQRLIHGAYRLESGKILILSVYR